MKIVCDSCGAKYSIADEKVAGKVFKIRCKKCSAVIVVRGDQVREEQEQPTQVYDYGGDAIWHVVVNGDQQGPFAPAQIGELLTASTIDWEAYVWREGFDGWMAARDVPELVEAVTGQPQGGEAQADPAYASEPPQTHEQADAFGAAQQPQADAYGQSAFAQGQEQGGFFGDAGAGQAADAGGGLFASAGASPFGGEGHEVASRAVHDAGADLFAQASASPFDAGGADEDVVASPNPRVGPQQAMTGQRNENSVLFSLSNLQALATGSSSSAGATPAVSMSASAARPGHASGEGSGLIDIKALASTTGPAGGMGGGRVDDLLSIGTGSALGSSLGAPVLAPVVEEKSHKGLMISIVAASAVLALAAIVVAVVIITKEPEPIAQAGSPAVTGAGVLRAPETPTTGGTENPQQPSGDQGQPTEGPGTEGATPDEETAAQARDRDRRRNPGATGGMTTAMETSAAAPVQMTTTSSMGSSDLDALLDNALGMMSSPTEMAAAPAADTNLPDTPPRDSVASGLRSVSGAVRSCGAGQHGMAQVTVTVSGATGRVTNAVVSGQFAGTPVGSCVARAVRGARFPRFRRSTFQVTFPYSL